MATLAERGVLSEKPDLRRRVRMALLVKAGTVLAAANPSASDLAYAKHVLLSVDPLTWQYQQLAAAFASVVDGDIADAALTAVVNQIWAKLAAAA